MPYAHLCGRTGRVNPCTLVSSRLEFRNSVVPAGFLPLQKKNAPLPRFVRVWCMEVTKREAHTVSQKLYRSTTDSMIGGVAAGLAKYFGIDPTLIRLVWLVSALFGGTGVFLYIVAWIIIPPEPDGDPSPVFEKSEELRERVIEAAKDVEERLKGAAQAGPDTDSPERVQKRRQALGWILIGIGVLLLARNVFSWFSLSHTWPLLLILGGIVLIVQEIRR